MTAASYRKDLAVAHQQSPTLSLVMNTKPKRVSLTARQSNLRLAGLTQLQPDPYV